MTMRAKRLAEDAQEKRTPKHRTPVQLGVSLELYTRLRRCAREDCLPLAAWLRQLAIKELRRRKSAA
jgi:hypothetical protein